MAVSDEMVAIALVNAIDRASESFTQLIDRLAPLAASPSTAPEVITVRLDEAKVSERGHDSYPIVRYELPDHSWFIWTVFEDTNGLKIPIYRIEDETGARIDLKGVRP